MLAKQWSRKDTKIINSILQVTTNKRLKTQRRHIYINDGLKWIKKNSRYKFGQIWLRMSRLRKKLAGKIDLKIWIFTFKWFCSRFNYGIVKFTDVVEESKVGLNSQPSHILLKFKLNKLVKLKFGLMIWNKRPLKLL